MFLAHCIAQWAKTKLPCDNCGFCSDCLQFEKFGKYAESINAFVVELFKLTEAIDEFGKTLKKET
jgi:hypothetical protein